jgi:hypothetical protein
LIGYWALVRSIDWALEQEKKRLKADWPARLPPEPTLPSSYKELKNSVSKEKMSRNIVLITNS